MLLVPRRVEANFSRTTHSRHSRARDPAPNTLRPQHTPLPPIQPVPPSAPQPAPRARSQFEQTLSAVRSSLHDVDRSVEAGINRGYTSFPPHPSLIIRQEVKLTRILPRPPSRANSKLSRCIRACNHPGDDVQDEKMLRFFFSERGRSKPLDLCDPFRRD